MTSCCRLVSAAIIKSPKKRFKSSTVFYIWGFLFITIIHYCCFLSIMYLYVLCYVVCVVVLALVIYHTIMYYINKCSYLARLMKTRYSRINWNRCGTKLSYTGICMYNNYIINKKKRKMDEYKLFCVCVFQ